MPSLGERMRRLFLSHEELENEELREQSEVAGVQTVASAEPRSRVQLRGTIVSLTSDAKNGWLEAEVNDGTGTVRPRVDGPWPHPVPPPGAPRPGRGSPRPGGRRARDLQPGLRAL